MYFLRKTSILLFLCHIPYLIQDHKSTNHLISPREATKVNQPSLTSKPGKPKADIDNQNLSVAGMFYF